MRNTSNNENAILEMGFRLRKKNALNMLSNLSCTTSAIDHLSEGLLHFPRTKDDQSEQWVIRRGKETGPIEN